MAVVVGVGDGGGGVDAFGGPVPSYTPLLRLPKHRHQLHRKERERLFLSPPPPTPPPSPPPPRLPTLLQLVQCRLPDQSWSREPATTVYCETGRELACVYVMTHRLLSGWMRGSVPLPSTLLMGPLLLLLAIAPPPVLPDKNVLSKKECNVCMVCIST